MYRLKFLTEYILNKERLLKVLPYQMKHFTESELNQRYSSYFPYKVKSLRDVLKVADLENDIEINCLKEEEISIKDINNQIRSKFPVKSKHPDVKRGNSMSLENVLNKGMEPGGSFELTPKLEMGDFIALSYKPTDVVGDIDRTPHEAITDLEKSLEIFPSQQLAFFDMVNLKNTLIFIRLLLKVWV